ncbi:MAG: transporter substrate-binding domain-containing protein [Pseudodesulfovibrio sp.]
MAALAALCVLAALVLLRAAPGRTGGERITAAVPTEFPPLYVAAPDGAVDGFAMDTLRGVARRAGLEFDILPVANWAEAMEAVRSGRADVIPGIGISPEREREFRFTDVFETIPVVCFARSDTPDLRSVPDLVGRRVGAMGQSAAHDRLATMGGITVIPFRSLDEGLFALLGGKVDAFAVPGSVLWKRARSIGVDDKLRMIGPPLLELKRGYLLRRDDKPLADRLNRAIGEYVVSRAFAQSCLKWWGQPRPFWTAGRIALAGGGLLLATAISLVLWRYRSVTGLNRGLEAARRNLEASETRLNKAQALAVVGSFEQDTATGEAHCSDGLFKLLGIPPEEGAPRLKDFIAMIHPDDRHGYLQAVASVTPEADCAVEFRFRPRGGGEYRHALSRFTLEAAEGGAPAKRIGAIMDITGRKRIEAQLTAAIRAAEEASRVKSEFLANMSHELRTPLNGAMGMMQLLAMDTLTGEQRDCVETALGCCRSLTQLLGDILDLSKVEANKLELFTERFAPADLLESVRATFRLQAEAKGLQLDGRIDPSAPAEVLGDPARLRQILFNLVGNALKFTDRGVVTVGVCGLSSTRPGRCRLLFTVTDSGIGIPENKIEAVFGAFIQADGAVTRKYQGTGLGLHIVKRLADLMGGTISVESEEGWGTTIHCCLPFESVAPSETSAPGRKRTSEAVGSKRMLVVEDERINRLALCRILEHLGHGADWAVNGEEALLKVARNAYDLIFMDIQMPVMNGVEATRRLRASKHLGEKRNVPVIALTAHAMSGDREAFLKAGMTGYLAKPVDLDELEAAIRNALARPSA